MSAYDLCHFGQDLCVKKWVIESFTYSIFSFRIHSFFSFAVSFDTIFVCPTKIDKITGNTILSHPTLTFCLLNYYTCSSKIYYILTMKR